jgi:hypothetical protein
MPENPVAAKKATERSQWLFLLPHPFTRLVAEFTSLTDNGGDVKVFQAANRGVKIFPRNS